MSSTRLKRLLPVLASLLVLAASLTALVQRQALADWWRLRNYNPPAAIVALADSTTMTDQAEHLFYVHHPSLEDKAAFNEHCRDGERTIVLGCYHSHRAIYIFNVNDPRLDGIKEVTAAHEMLHAAYDRLDKAERQRIDGLTDQVFRSLNNERLNKTVASYREHDASEVPNELHSILGTEVRVLPAELETYYRRYFSDRLAVVGFSERYEQAFTERQNKVASYDAQLGQLKTEIEAAQTDLDNRLRAIEAERERLDELLAAKQYQSYNAGVPGYNAQIRDYNASVANLRALIDQYNQLVTERNAIALEQNELVKAIDSRPNTLPTQ